MKILAVIGAITVITFVALIVAEWQLKRWQNRSSEEDKESDAE